MREKVKVMGLASRSRARLHHSNKPPNKTPRATTVLPLQPGTLVAVAGTHLGPKGWDCSHARRRAQGAASAGRIVRVDVLGKTYRVRFIPTDHPDHPRYVKTLTDFSYKGLRDAYEADVSFRRVEQLVPAAAQIVAILAKHAPDKVKRVRRLLAKHAGKESALLYSFIHTYYR